MRISTTCSSGEIGRHVRFRFVCFTACGFESHLEHHKKRPVKTGLFFVCESVGREPKVRRRGCALAQPETVAFGEAKRAERKRAPRRRGFCDSKIKPRVQSHLEHQNKTGTSRSFLQAAACTALKGCRPYAIALGNVLSRLIKRSAKYLPMFNQCARGDLNPYSLAGTGA